MKILFAPDYRPGNPYQTHLADALNRTGDCTVRFAQGYRRVLPLTRLCRDEHPDLLHLHWPEAYCPTFGPLAFLRPWRLPIDMAMATHAIPYVLTAHNLWPHHQPRSAGLQFALGRTYRGARSIIAHSLIAAELVSKQWNVPQEKIVIIPHGNLVNPMAVEAHPQDEKSCSYVLNFGTIAPYKGIEDLIIWWRRNRSLPPLRILGICNDPKYAENLQRLAGDDPAIQLCPGKVSDESLIAEIQASSAVVLNHHAGLTSSVASMARSLSANILIPRRLMAVDLMEPHPSVFRFESLETDFAGKLSAALKAPTQPKDENWWRSIAWDTVAAATQECYYRACVS